MCSNDRNTFSSSVGVSQVEASHPDVFSCELNFIKMGPAKVIVSVSHNKIKHFRNQKISFVNCITSCITELKKMVLGSIFYKSEEYLCLWYLLLYMDFIEDSIRVQHKSQKEVIYRIEMPRACLDP